MIKNLSRFVLCLLAVAIAGGPTSVSGQTLVSTKGKVKVFKGGLAVEGKNLQVTGESVSLDIDDQTTFFDLSEIDRVDRYKNNAKKGACIGGGSCFAIGLIVVATASEETLADAGGTRGEAFAGVLLWTAIFGAGGGLVGKLSSGWETIYYRTESRNDAPERPHLVLGAGPMGTRGGMVRLTYSF